MQHATLTLLTQSLEAAAQVLAELLLSPAAGAETTPATTAASASKLGLQLPRGGEVETVPASIAGSASKPQTAEAPATDSQARQLSAGWVPAQTSASLDAQIAAALQFQQQQLDAADPSHAAVAAAEQIQQASDWESDLHMDTAGSGSKRTATWASAGARLRQHLRLQLPQVQLLVALHGSLTAQLSEDSEQVGTGLPAHSLASKTWVCMLVSLYNVCVMHMLRLPQQLASSHSGSSTASHHF